MRNPNPYPPTLVEDVPTRDPEALFREVVRLTGLSAIVGSGAVRRALDAAEVSREEASPEDYLRIIPELSKRISLYLSVERLVDTIADVRAFLEHEQRRWTDAAA